MTVSDATAQVNNNKTRFGGRWTHVESEDMSFREFKARVLQVLYERLKRPCQPHFVDAGGHVLHSWKHLRVLQKMDIIQGQGLTQDQDPTRDLPPLSGVASHSSQRKVRPRGLQSSQDTPSDHAFPTIIIVISVQFYIHVTVVLLAHCVLEQDLENALRRTVFRLVLKHNSSLSRFGLVGKQQGHAYSVLPSSTPTSLLPVWPERSKVRYTQ